MHAVRPLDDIFTMTPDCLMGRPPFFITCSTDTRRTVVGKTELSSGRTVVPSHDFYNRSTFVATPTESVTLANFLSSLNTIRNFPPKGAAIAV